MIVKPIINKGIKILSKDQVIFLLIMVDYYGKYPVYLLRLYYIKLNK